MIKLTRLIYVVFVFFLFVLGCDKAETEAPRAVQIIDPINGSIIPQLDTIELSIKINPELFSGSLVIKLVNAQFIPVGITQTIPVAAGEAFVEFSYITSFSAPTNAGVYYLLLEHFVENESYKQFVLLDWKGKAAEKGSWVFLSEQSDSLELLVYNTDFEFVKSALFYWPDLNQSLYNANAAQLLLAGSLTENLLSISIDSMQSVWSVPRPVFQPIRFPFGLCNYNNQFFVAYAQDFIRSYNDDGVVSFSVPFPEDEYAQSIAANSDFVLIGFRSLNQLRRGLRAYYRGTSSYHQEIEMHFECSQMYFCAHDSALIFGNLDGKAHIEIYKLATNTLRPVTLSTDAAIIAVEDCGLGHYAVLCTDGLYMYHQQQLEFVLDIGAMQLMAARMDLPQILLSDGHKILLYDWSARKTLMQQQMPQRISGMHYTGN